MINPKGTESQRCIWRNIFFIKSSIQFIKRVCISTYCPQTPTILLQYSVLRLQFNAWDKEAGMHVYKGEKPREEKEKRKERELVNVARDIFGRQTRITYIDLCEQLQQVLDIKERTAKSYIRFMRERDIITKDTANQSCFVIGSYHLQRNASCP